MKRTLLLLPLFFLLVSCGRTYTLVGRVVFLDATLPTITEVTGKPMPSTGTPIVAATITLFHEVSKGKPKRDTIWKSSTATDQTGTFHLSDYAAPGNKNVVGLEVTADGYEPVFTTYVDYINPDEQSFFIVLQKSP